MFRLAAERIEVMAGRQALADCSAGAVVDFEGRVRNHNDGQAVTQLEYEAYEALAISEGERILAEARQRFEVQHAECVHRTGLIPIGETAVWVGVSAAHRDAAFRACRYIIDEIKARLPIWKRETYADGHIGWVNCQHAVHQHHATVSSESDYYARQMILPELGASGQEKLRQARVLVVGGGGLGSPALLYLAGAGVGTLGICEFDQLDVSNLHRQILYAADGIGQSKAVLAAERLRALNPHINVISHEMRLHSNNAAELFNQYDLVLDCTDNQRTHFLVNDTAVATGTPLVQACVYQYEGQVSLYVPDGNSSCLRCLWPDMLNVETCEETGVLGVVPGMLGTLQAAEALKLLLGLPTPLNDHLLIFDLFRYETRLIRRAKSLTCPVCSNCSTQTAKDIADTLEIEWPSGTLEDYILVDIRELQEQASKPLSMPAIKRPCSQWDQHLPLDSTQKYLLCCSRGLRSLQLALRLRDEGYASVFALRGGLEANKKMQPLAEAFS